MQRQSHRDIEAIQVCVFNIKSIIDREFIDVGQGFNNLHGVLQDYFFFRRYMDIKSIISVLEILNVDFGINESSANITRLSIIFNRREFGTESINRRRPELDSVDDFIVPFFNENKLMPFGMDITQILNISFTNRTYMTPKQKRIVAEFFKREGYYVRTHDLRFGDEEQIDRCYTSIFRYLSYNRERRSDDDLIIDAIGYTSIFVQLNYNQCMETLLFFKNNNLINLDNPEVLMNLFIDIRAIYNLENVNLNFGYFQSDANTLGDFVCQLMMNHNQVRKFVSYLQERGRTEVELRPEATETLFGPEHRRALSEIYNSNYNVNIFASVYDSLQFLPSIKMVSIVENVFNSSENKTELAHLETLRNFNSSIQELKNGIGRNTQLKILERNLNTIIEILETCLRTDIRNLPNLLRLRNLTIEQKTVLICEIIKQNADHAKDISFVPSLFVLSSYFNKLPDSLLKSEFENNSIKIYLVAIETVLKNQDYTSSGCIAIPNQDHFLSLPLESKAQTLRLIMQSVNRNPKNFRVPFLAQTDKLLGFVEKFIQNPEVPESDILDSLKFSLTIAQQQKYDFRPDIFSKEITKGKSFSSLSNKFKIEIINLFLSRVVADIPSFTKYKRNIEDILKVGQRLATDPINSEISGLPHFRDLLLFVVEQINKKPPTLKPKIEDSKRKSKSASLKQSDEEEEFEFEEFS
ncbi:MAG: hypothetical protein LBJ93_02475 [Clostridiales bacterium]|jgi:hypothetical protein|nr:hypothetical protein [Clostridiales bacterium]